MWRQTIPYCAPAVPGARTPKRTNPGPVEVDRRPHYPKLRVQFLVAFWTIFKTAESGAKILKIALLLSYESVTYPVLRSLRRSGLLTSYVGASIPGAPRKYYSPSNSGRRALKEWKQVWQRTQGIVNLILEEKHVRSSQYYGRHSPIS